ncbi:MAG: universal stress protein [Deltaproteobacteria bacterium]|nr:MAG: universal stress protein [Deltaproteobacteria bacterium]
MVPEIKKILYPTDLSKNARYAFSYAASMANHYGAGVTILHVLEEPSPVALGMVTDFVGKERWEEMRKEKQESVIQNIKSRLQDFCDEVSEELPACPFIVDDILVRIGHPVDVIIDERKKAGCDLVVMGSRGRGILSGAVLGSTSKRVLRRCDKPVLVVRLPEGD